MYFPILTFLFFSQQFGGQSLFGSVSATSSVTHDVDERKYEKIVRMFYSRSINGF